MSCGEISQNVCFSRIDIGILLLAGRVTWCMHLVTARTNAKALRAQVLPVHTFDAGLTSLMINNLINSLQILLSFPCLWIPFSKSKSILWLYSAISNGIEFKSAEIKRKKKGALTSRNLRSEKRRRIEPILWSLRWFFQLIFGAIVINLAGTGLIRPGVTSFDHCIGVACAFFSAVNRTAAHQFCVCLNTARCRSGRSAENGIKQSAGSSDFSARARGISLEFVDRNGEQNALQAGDPIAGVEPVARRTTAA